MKNQKKLAILGKLAAVAALFLVVSFALPQPSVTHPGGFVLFTGWWQMILCDIVGFYALTWLYRWAVRGSFKGWHLQSAAAVGIGVGLHAVVLFFLLSAVVTDENWFLDASAVQSVYGILIWIIVFLAMFFLLDGRKPQKPRRKPQKGLWIAAIVGAAVCISGLIVYVSVSTVDGGITYSEYVWNAGIDIRGQEAAIRACVWIALFLLLWVGTAPGKRTVCSDTGEPRDLGEYTKERKPQRTAKKVKMGVREWVRKNKL
ncbi:MAG: hypothetical protein VB082_10705 [Christensenella sp.]|nr:hypothetical protein [Christensenella sp.]